MTVSGDSSPCAVRKDGSVSQLARTEFDNCVLEDLSFDFCCTIGFFTLKLLLVYCNIVRLVVGNDEDDEDVDGDDDCTGIVCDDGDGTSFGSFAVNQISFDLATTHQPPPPA